MFVMLSSIRTGKIKFKIVFILACFIFMFNSNYALSQTKLPEVIRIGTRTAALAIGTYNRGDKKIGGFCGLIFEEGLRTELAKEEITSKVTNQPIFNQYGGRTYTRYQGLLEENPEKKIDIECGPNSPDSGELLDKNTGKLYKNEVIFSNYFNQSGVKLLLRKDIARKLAKIPVNELESEMKKQGLCIGVMQNTTTYDRLKKRVCHQAYSTRNEALRALDIGKTIQAFASDALIVQTLLDKGIEGDKIETYRPPYSDNGFTLFPLKAKDYLFNLGEKHAIVIKKTKNSDYDRKFISIINNTLSNIGNSNSFDNAEEDSAIINESNSKENYPSPLPTPMMERGEPIYIIFLGIFALISIIVIFAITILAIARRYIIHQYGEGDNFGGSRKDKKGDTSKNNSQQDEDK